MIPTFFKACSSNLKTKVTDYSSNNKFDKSDFLCSLKKANCDFFKNDPNQKNLLTDNFFDIANKHAPLKKKFIRVNNTPFINRELQKKTFVGSRLRKKHEIQPFVENNQKEVSKLTKVFGILLNPS